MSPRRPRRPDAPGPPTAPGPEATSPPDAGREARRLAAAVLEVLAGMQTPSEAARALSISLARYYQLEQRALAGLVSACEARRRGRGRPGGELAELRRECERLRRECARQQALVRAARRSVGLGEVAPAPSPPPQGPPRRRRRRPVARALKAAAALREGGGSSAEVAPPAPAGGEVPAGGPGPP